MINYKELLLEAYKESLNSLDPSTQNGALLVDRDGLILSRDHNRFPNKVEYKKERWERPLKYKIIAHAENGSIFKAAKHGVPTQNLIMVCPWSACSECAKAIIQSGIVELARHKQAIDRSPDLWKQEIEVADMMLKEAGVLITEYSGIISDGKLGVLHSGSVWNP